MITHMNINSFSHGLAPYGMSASIISKSIGAIKVKGLVRLVAYTFTGKGKFFLNCAEIRKKAFKFP